MTILRWLMKAGFDNDLREKNKEKGLRCQITHIIVWKNQWQQVLLNPDFNILVQIIISMSVEAQEGGGNSHL